MIAEKPAPKMGIDTRRHTATRTAHSPRRLQRQQIGSYCPAGVVERELRRVELALTRLRFFALGPHASPVIKRILGLPSLGDDCVVADDDRAERSAAVRAHFFSDIRRLALTGLKVRNEKRNDRRNDFLPVGMPMLASGQRAQSRRAVSPARCASARSIGRGCGASTTRIRVPTHRRSALMMGSSVVDHGTAAATQRRRHRYRGASRSLT
jgi:hypothetical protein